MQTLSKVLMKASQLSTRMRSLTMHYTIARKVRRWRLSTCKMGIVKSKAGCRRFWKRSKRNFNVV